jgi:hypothetical protein
MKHEDKAERRFNRSETLILKDTASYRRTDQKRNDKIREALNNFEVNDIVIDICGCQDSFPTL